MAEMNNTVSDVIGGEYQKWKPNDKIFISSPTGTGKTYFILNVLLPYAYQKEKQILLAFFDILGTSKMLNKGDYQNVYDYYSERCHGKQGELRRREGNGYFAKTDEIGAGFLLLRGFML